MISSFPLKYLIHVFLLISLHLILWCHSVKCWSTGKFTEIKLSLKMESGGILFILVLIWTINNWGRSLLSYMVQKTSLKDDTGLDALDYGIISGPGFLIPFGFASLAISRIIDSSSRPQHIVMACAALSSIFVACEALAFDFWSLLWPRALFAVWAAGIVNGGYFFIANYYR